jgi:hypothetical protein
VDAKERLAARFRPFVDRLCESQSTRYANLAAAGFAPYFKALGPV